MRYPIVIHDLAQGWPGPQEPSPGVAATRADAHAAWWPGWWSRLLGRAGIFAGWH